MNKDRLDTAQILQSGILLRQPPETDIPEDLELFEADCDLQFVGMDAVIAALNEGKLVSAANYYGVFYAWRKSSEAFRCILLQYRQVTENSTVETAEDAAAWVEEIYEATYG